VPDIPIVQQVQALLDQARDWLNSDGLSIETLLTTPVLGQVIILLIAAGLAHLIHSRTDGFSERFARGQSDRHPAARFGAILFRRRRPLMLAVALWIGFLTLSQSFPDQSFRLLRVGTNLAGAWVLISILTTLIRNRPMARLTAMGIWFVAALNILGILPAALEALDSLSVSVGDNRVTALAIINAILMAIVLVWFASFASRVVEMRLQGVSDLQPTTKVLLGKLFRIAALVAAIVIALDLTGIDLTALAVFSGAVGLGIGFGLQKVISNLVSGFILLLDRSIKPGDVITLDQTYGWINQLRARYVSVITRDGREHLIPNEELITQKVINWSFSHTRVRLEISFGVAYDSDPHQVRELAVSATRDVKRVLAEPRPVCHFTEFGDSSLNFVLRFWIQDPADGVMNVRGLVLLALWDIFKEHGIAIPFPHREVIFRNPLEVIDVRDAGIASDAQQQTKD